MTKLLVLIICLFVACNTVDKGHSTLPIVTIPSDTTHVDTLILIDTIIVKNNIFEKAYKSLTSTPDSSRSCDDSCNYFILRKKELHVIQIIDSKLQKLTVRLDNYGKLDSVKLLKCNDSVTITINHSIIVEAVNKHEYPDNEEFIQVSSQNIEIKRRIIRYFLQDTIYHNAYYDGNVRIDNTRFGKYCDTLKTDTNIATINSSYYSGFHSADGKYFSASPVRWLNNNKLTIAIESSKSFINTIDIVHASGERAQISEL
jgi:hypothetical protein